MGFAVKVPTSEAFRAQLIVPEHRQLFDYWLEKSGKKAMPCRDEISPAHFPRLLPNISLIDCEPKTGKFKIRLAGTRLREIFGREITGEYVDTFGIDSAPDYWSSICQQVKETTSPAQGIAKSPAGPNDHLVQFWLRLPLGSPSGQVEMLLALDTFLPAAEMSELQTICA